MPAPLTGPGWSGHNLVSATTPFSTGTLASGDVPGSLRFGACDIRRGYRSAAVYVMRKHPWYSIQRGLASPTAEAAGPPGHTRLRCETAFQSAAGAARSRAGPTCPPEPRMAGEGGSGPAAFGIDCSLRGAARNPGIQLVRFREDCKNTAGDRIIPSPVCHRLFRNAGSTYLLSAAAGAAATPAPAGSLALRSSCSFASCSLIEPTSFSETFRYSVEFLGL